MPLRLPEYYQWLGLQWPATRQLTLAEGGPMAAARLTATAFIRSPSQPDTPADGDCFFHALVDQCSYDRYFPSFLLVPASQYLAIVLLLLKTLC